MDITVVKRTSREWRRQLKAHLRGFDWMALAKTMALFAAACVAGWLLSQVVLALAAIAQAVLGPVLGTLIVLGMCGVLGYIAARTLVPARRTEYVRY